MALASLVWQQEPGLAWQRRPVFSRLVWQRLVLRLSLVWRRLAWQQQFLQLVLQLVLPPI
jgi:hypothetical protein